MSIKKTMFKQLLFKYNDQLAATANVLKLIWLEAAKKGTYHFFGQKWKITIRYRLMATMCALASSNLTFPKKKKNNSQFSAIFSIIFVLDHFKMALH